MMYETYKAEFVNECEKAITFLREIKTFIEHHSDENDLYVCKETLRRCFLSIDSSIDDLKHLTTLDKKVSE